MSHLMLAEQPDVGWARFLEGGGEGGTAAFQIDASGLTQRNRMMYRSLVPNGTSPSMKVRLRLTSSLVVSNPAFEGIAARFRGFQLTGAAPSRTDTQVWDSDPASKGLRAWHSTQSTAFEDAVFIEPIPSDLGIDYLTIELVVRASAGQVTISNVECRNHYSTSYDLSIAGSQLWTSGFTEETVVTGIGADLPVVRFLRYISTTAINIEKGQLVRSLLKGALTGRAYETQSGSNAQRLAASVGIMAKYRRKLTPTLYDYFTIYSGGVSVESKTTYADTSAQFKAPYAYDQVELQPFVEPSELSAGYDFRDVDRLGIEDIDLELIVADWVTPSQ